MSVTGFVDCCHDIASFGVALCLQSGLILVSGLSLAALLRRCGPFVQSFVLRATLAAVALTVGFSALLSPYTHPLWRVSLSGATDRPHAMASAVDEAPAPAQVAWSSPSLPPTVPAPAVALATPAEESSSPPRDVHGDGLPTMPLTSQRPARPLMSWVPTLLVVVWGTGALGLLLWGMIGQLSLWMLRRRSSPLTTGMASEVLQSIRPEHPLPLRVSPHIRSPFLGGLRQPTVFLPASYSTDFDRLTLRTILAHELAHRDRHDNHWLLLTRLLCAVLWVQPLCWVLARCLEQASEESCDAAALQSGCSRHSYAGCLLSLAERMTPSSLERAMGSGSAPLRSRVGRRIQNILHRRGDSVSRISGRMTALVILSLAAAAVCGTVFVSAGAAPSAPANTPSQIIVQKYLDARASGQYATAFTLLTSGSWTSLAPLQNWSQGQDLSRLHIDAGQLSLAMVMDAFFEDTHNTLQAQYRVIGAVPGQPNVIQVAVHLPNQPNRDVTLKVALTPEHSPINAMRIDLLRSVKETVPSEYPRFVGRAAQKLCLSHLKQLGLATLEYMQDHGEHFPHAAHWVDEIMPYVKDVSLFHDPAAPAGQKYSYAFNRNLSGLSLARLNYQSQTVLIFDSNRGVKNASDTGQSLPQPGRHTEGNDFLFTDGHAKYLREWRWHATFSPSDELPVQAPGVGAENARPSQPPVVPSDQAAITKPGTDFLAGLTAVQGPGVIVTLNDSHKKSPYGAGRPAYLIHDSDINQLISELKRAGAKAIAINDQRLVATSSVRAAGQTIMVNNVPQAPPWVVTAIGDPRSLAFALNQPGGVREELRKSDPAMIQIKPATHVVLPSYAGPTQERYAKPIKPSNGTGRQGGGGGHAGRQGVADTAQLATVAAERAAIYSQPHAQGRVLSVCPKGLNLAIWGQTATDYSVLMIDHSLGYIAKDVVHLLDYKANSDTPTTSIGQQMVQTAYNFLRVPYVRRGSTHTGIDDADLVQAVYTANKVPLPRSVLAQAGVGYDVPHNVTAGDWRQWLPGDRLYFDNRQRINHTGMYIGNGLFIHASTTHNRQVAIDPVADAYYSRHLVAVRRSRELLSQ